MPPVAASLTKSVKRAAYSAAQIARIAWFTGHYAAGRRKMGPLTGPGEAPYAEEFGPLDRTRLKTAFRELFRTDWRNIDRGDYKLPLDMRRPPSLTSLYKASRDYLRDTNKIAQRRRSNGHSEVMNGAAAGQYPRYFLQNFHYQTDGWLSETSADRYDMQVEALFQGAGDAMRRQALPVIREAIGSRDPAKVALLDLACGTGRFLKTVKDNWPKLDATALDLSPAYLGKARATLGAEANMQFVQANAEVTGLPSASYDIIACVYLFHELPPAVRRSVATEIARLLKPGGALIQLDTIQYGDEPGFDILLENFPRGFHEPYYDSYCREDLDGIFGEAGLSSQEKVLAFMTKVSVYNKADERY